MAPQASLAKIGKEGFDIIDKFFGKQKQVSYQYYQPQDSYTYYAPPEAYTARATKAYYPAQEARAVHEPQPARVTKANYQPPEATTASSYHYYERTAQSVEYQKPIYRSFN